MSPLHGPPDEFQGVRGTLCQPDAQKNCFRCCPPIRPAGYDHIMHRTVLSRRLARNTESFRRKGPDAGAVISGVDCWGLGYLDDGGRRIGCLLHPLQNSGVDHRDRTGYGEKCRREWCREAQVFASLQPDEAGLVLRLADGLDSFEYSSPQWNPAFRLLNWGPRVIGELLRHDGPGLNRTSYRERWAVLDRTLDPKQDGFPLERLLDRHTLSDLAATDFITRYLAAMAPVIRQYRRVMTPPLDNRPFVHQLDLPPALTSFLRSALGCSRSSKSQAERIQRAVETALAGL